MLFEEALPLRGSDAVLSTLSLVQVRPWGAKAMVMLQKSPRLRGCLKSLGLCCSPLSACLAGVSFFLPEMAEFWCPAWLTGPQREDHMSQRLGKGSVCNRCCACVIPAQHQWEDSGPACSRDREPVGAGCGPSGLVSVQSPTGSEGACLKAGLTPQTKPLEASPHCHPREGKL